MAFPPCVLPETHCGDEAAACARLCRDWAASHSLTVPLMVPFVSGSELLHRSPSYFALAAISLLQSRSVLGAVHLAGLTRVQVPSPLTLNSSTGRGPRATWQEDEGRRRPCALSMGSVGPALYRRA